MAQEAKMSFIGLANWIDDELFDMMCWPDPFDGDTPILDKEAFIYELFAQTAELEVSYPNPQIMKGMIGIWSKIMCPVWNALWETTTYEYNPIENYNRIEDGTDTDVHTGTDSNGRTTTHTGQNTDSHSGTDTETHSGTDSYDETLTKAGTDTNTTTPLSEHYKAAYDSAASGNNDGLVKTERDEGETVNETVYGTTDTTDGSTTHGHVVTNAHGETITHGYGTTDTESGSVTFGNTMTHNHDLNVHGNIGTVTTQQMIKEQREIVTFNFYNVMIRDFKERFCVLVY